MQYMQSKMINLIHIMLNLVGDLVVGNLVGDLLNLVGDLVGDLV